MNRYILFILLITVTSVAWGQSTRVRGKITDAKTGEPLPLVNVVFKGTTVGVTSDFDGIYTLETREKVTELQASFVGYESQTVKVVPGSYNALDFQLVPYTVDLEEVNVTPGENPAHRILKNVSRNKKKNNPDELSLYKCSTYTKMELDLTNINPYFKNKKLQKNFGFIFEHMDTSVITGKAFLPIMISEATADYYHRSSPGFSREIVKASRISGIEEDYSLAQFTGHLHVNVNLYDNYINIFEVKFASPLSEHGLLYYKYFLVDSMQINGRKTYKIRFHPKGTSTPVLDGEVNIDSASWALQSAHVKMLKGLNVNWIRHLVIENTNELVNDSVWFPKQDKLFADFTIVMSDSAKLVSFLGHRQIDYTHVRLNEPIPEEVLKLDNNVIISRDVLKNDEQYWDTVRPYELSVKEKQIYGMVDSVKNVPLYQNIYTIISTILGGYYDTKYVGIGPYYKLFSFNKLEGCRFQLGLRTTSDFSKKIRLFGHLAYGTKDRHFKGGGGLEYMFKDLPTSKLTLSFKHDVVQLGAGVNAFTEGNILSSILSRGNNDRLSLVNQGDISFEQEWRQGVSNTFAAQVRNIFSSRYVPFIRPDGKEMSSIQSLSFRLRTRLSKNEIIVRQTFDKFSLGSDYPIFTLDLSAGVKGIFKNDYEYYRLEGTVMWDIGFPPIGTSKFALSGGKIFGKVPYPLLKLHEGNATYFYDPYAFSCMNYYEFASDLWASLMYEHHFKGFFLGKIPLMKRLKWREVFIFKALIGTLEKKNNGSLEDTRAILLFPEGMSSVSKPYFEAGVGIENIFRILRVDAIWRLSHRHSVPGQKVQNFAVNFSINLNF
ncbi:MAG: carboxypeptidase-like regulatory domain-containing protein [Odoribacter sp.]|nr:carboxypeptidase-like regulatory domain-containing protein [Odoribacter sp.]